MPRVDELVPRLVPGQMYRFGAKPGYSVLYGRLEWPPPLVKQTQWRDVLGEEFMYIGPEHESSGAAIHICLLTGGVLVYVTTTQFELAGITKI